MGTQAYVQITDSHGETSLYFRRQDGGAQTALDLITLACRLSQAKDMDLQDAEMGAVAYLERRVVDNHYERKSAMDASVCFVYECSFQADELTVNQFVAPHHADEVPGAFLRAWPSADNQGHRNWPSRILFRATINPNKDRRLPLERLFRVNRVDFSA